MSNEHKPAEWTWDMIPALTKAAEAANQAIKQATRKENKMSKTDKCSSNNPVVQRLFAASESFADDKPAQGHMLGVSWTADVRNDGEGHYFVEDEGGNVICNITRVTETGEHEWANARLIAAAPDLLAACKAALSTMDKLSPAHVQVRIAIAKAEGRA